MSIVGNLSALSHSSEVWMGDSVCSSTDPEIFFPERGTRANEAKSVCRGCPVIKECLEFALRTNQQWGVFGGYTHRERRNMRHGRPAQRTACLRGHEYAVFGKRRDGSCSECRRITQRRDWHKRTA